jgi:alpha-tubulin suppressor-like RCC1 family protein
MLLLCIVAFCAACTEPWSPPDEPEQPVASVWVAPDSMVLEGATIQLRVVLRDSAGEELSGRAIAYRTTNPRVVTVTAEGLVRAEALGFASIVVASEGVVDTADIDVRVLFRSISAGRHHTCAITTGGSAYCWGRGHEGRLGDGTDLTRRTPVKVLGDLAYRHITSGGRFTCGLVGQDAYCWGANRSMQLGSGTKHDALQPVQVVGALSFSTISSFGLHSCGLTEVAAYCWGAHWAGQLGDVAKEEWWLGPQAVAGGTWFVSMSPGWNYTCGVTVDGEAYCWGYNDWQQLGRADAPDECIGVKGALVPCSPTPMPVPVAGGVEFASVAAGANHACALTAAGHAYCWGDNSSGQLGSGASGGMSGPTSVVGGLTFAVLDASDRHTCGLTADGVAYCWGDNGYGALGTTGSFESCGGRLCSTSPIPVTGGFRFQSITAAAGTVGGHSCGVTVSNEAYCWGRNDWGQLGIGARGGNSTIPVRVFGQP